MSAAMVSHDEYLEVLDLLTRYALAIDHDRLEEWAQCFTETGHYKVITLENVQQGLQAGMLTCTGQAMLQDRVAYIRKAAVYNIHRDRHILSHPLIRRTAQDRYEVVTSFALYQSEPDRDSRLFAVGYYEDVIVREAAGLRFASRIAVLENNSITPLLSAPV
jgi:3-phenylpropionate/cinnamic acid dioxygenase small subunit